MSIEHAAAGQVIDLSPLGAEFSQHKTTTLAKTETLELIRLVLPAGRQIPPHQAKGAITVQCLEGHVRFSVEGEARDLKASSLLYLDAQQTHALEAMEDSSLLLTLVLPAKPSKIA